MENNGLRSVGIHYVVCFLKDSVIINLQIASYCMSVCQIVSIYPRYMEIVSQQDIRIRSVKQFQ